MSFPVEMKIEIGFTDLHIHVHIHQDDEKLQARLRELEAKVGQATEDVNKSVETLQNIGEKGVKT